MEGVAAKKALLDRYNEIASNYSDETADEMAKLQDQIDSKNLWDLDSQVDLAMDALRCPADDADVTKLSGGERRRVACAACCSMRPTCCCSTSRPTTSTRKASTGWKAICAIIRAPSSSSPTTDTSSTTSPAGSSSSTTARHPLRGQLTSWLHQKQKRMEQEGREDEARRRTLNRESEWIASSPKARQSKSKARYKRYEELLKIANAKQNTVAQITIPSRNVSASTWSTSTI